MKPRNVFHPLSWMSFRFRTHTHLELWAVEISYEETQAIVLLSALLLNGPFTRSPVIITQKHPWLIFPSWPLPRVWLLKEKSGGAPFDLTEVELKALFSFNVENATGTFTLFFLETMSISFSSTFSQQSNPILGAFHNPYKPELYTANVIIKTPLTISFLWIWASYP